MELSKNIPMLHEMFLLYYRGFNKEEISEHMKREFDIDVAPNYVNKLRESEGWVEQAKDLKAEVRKEAVAQARKYVRKRLLSIKEMVDDVIEEKWADLKLNPEQIKNMSLKDLLDYMKLAETQDGGVTNRVETKEIKISLAAAIIKKEKEEEEEKKDKEDKIEIKKDRFTL